MKRPTPRRRKDGVGARLRRYWIPIALLAAALCAAAAFAATWSGFDPKEVDVYGNRTVPRAEIVAAAAVAPNVNMWLQSPRAIESRVEAIPYVARAHVSRVPPATIAISVEERAPYALARSGRNAALVDKDLRVLQTLAAAPVGTPLVELRLERGAGFVPGTFLSDPASVALRDDYAAMLAAHVVPVALEHDRFGGLVATLRGGLQLLLGTEDDLARKLALVDPILAQVARRDRAVKAIDLRAPGTPVVVYGN